jgi:hypothetical protein
MESGCGDSGQVVPSTRTPVNRVSLECAAQIVITRGRVYVYKRCRHANLAVFTAKISEIDLLKRVFGGDYYKHRAGYYWVLGKREDQLRLLELVQPFLQQEHRLTKLIALLSPLQT